jgi:hypothetical protein
VTSRQHGRGHETLVSHSTDVGCIFEETIVKKLLLVSAMLLVVSTAADAQSWGRGGAYTGAGSGGVTGPRLGMRSCGWSITAACAARRNGSYTRDGITHKFVGRKPNGRMIVHVYRENTRIK